MKLNKKQKKQYHELMQKALAFKNVGINEEIATGLILADVTKTRMRWLSAFAMIVVISVMAMITLTSPKQVTVLLNVSMDDNTVKVAELMNSSIDRIMDSQDKEVQFFKVYNGTYFYNKTVPFAICPISQQYHEITCECAKNGCLKQCFICTNRTEKKVIGYV